MNYKFIILTSILIITFALLLYAFLYYKFDKNIERDVDELAKKFESGPLESLLNGSSINNIPELNIISTNPSVNKANKCAKGPVYIGTFGTDHDCVRTCDNSLAHVLIVNDDEIVTYDSTNLQPGAHCILRPKPECDTKTTVVLMTVNSIICRSKFPNIVGGQIGTTVIACNNKIINDPKNYLWDYKTNEKFDPLSTVIVDENELLEDGTYRFRCVFEGRDIRNNKYMEHPFNRFHPISNYCAALIYSAHPDVRTVINAETGDFTCMCGDPEKTRVYNLDPYDVRSQCTNKQITIENLEKDKRRVVYPYRCFTLFSPIEDVGKYFPCPEDQFTREGSMMATASIIYSEHMNALIEHPMYAKFQDSVFVDDGRVIG